MIYDYIVVGSGLFGAVFAHELHKAGKKCLVIEKREHRGGNVYCELLEGINVHKYGAHIFHTSNKRIWEYVNSFVEFNRYTNSPVANYKGKLYNLPFNMNTFYQMWGVITPDKARKVIEEQKKQALASIDLSENIQPRNLEEQAISLVGTDIYEVLIKGYTEKQWGRKCVDLPPSIIKRIPIRFVYDNNYFSDKYQGIPNGGYNRLIDALLEGIEVRTNTDFFDNREYWLNHAKKIVYTGKIDEFYEYRFGRLEYRTVNFVHEILDLSNFQGNAVINYTDSETPFTRIIEHKHFESFGDEIFANKKTVISKEYSVEWKMGMEPYYPINDNRNTVIYHQYKEVADRESRVIFGGRLAEYKYYDMAPTIESALNKVQKELEK